METKQVIKYALIGVGVYLIYRQFFQHDTGQTQPLLVRPQPQPQPTPGQTQTQPPESGRAQTSPQPAPVSVPVTEAQLVAWANNEQLAAAAPAGITYTIDEWNYFRSQGGGTTIDAVSVPGINDSNRSLVRFKASAYWAALKAGGLSGYSLTNSNPGMGHIAFGDQFSWLT